MQLLSQMQWWSKTATHRLHVPQCFVRAPTLHSQTRQKNESSITCWPVANRSRFPVSCSGHEEVEVYDGGSRSRWDSRPQVGNREKNGRNGGGAGEGAGE